jgi:Fur family peroxide stress response transcriptional regulator
LLTVDSGVKYLQSVGAKVTATRVAIMKSLADRGDHPSAEQLFLELKPFHPSLSIATVYSTAQLLAKGSLLRIISIDEKKVCFDPKVEPHGHFMCRKCKRVFDTQLGFDLMEADMPGYVSSVEYAEIFYYGLCSKCA